MEADHKAFEDAGTGDIDTFYVANMGPQILQGRIHLRALLAEALGKRAQNGGALNI